MTPISHPRTEGFTLVEMLVVLTIVVLLAAVAATQLSSAGHVGRRPRLLADLRHLLDEKHEQAIATGSVQAVASSELAKIDGRLSLFVPDGTKTLRYFGDSSSSGGRIDLGGEPLLTIDWLNGDIRDAR